MAKKEKSAEEKVLTKQELKDQKRLEKQKQKEKAKKEKKPGMFKKLREAWGELKKVTWPSFGDVCKKTGVVLVVVLIFAVVIFGIDYCLGLLMGLLR